MNVLLLRLLAFFLLFHGARASSQSDSTMLTLQECIQRAREHGPLCQMAWNAFESQRAAYRSFLAGFYPQLSLQGEVPGYTRSINPIVLPDGSTVFTPQSEASSSLNLSLSQKIPLTGGQLFLSSGLNRIDLIESKSKLYRSTPLTMSLRQPIFQINTMQWDREAEDLRNERASRELAQALEECAIDIANKFFEMLLASIASTNAALNLATNDTLYAISRGRFNVGRIAENDLLQSELAYLNAQTQLENAGVELQRTHENLRVALGFGPDTRLSLVTPDVISVHRVDPDEALDYARQNRTDMVDFDLQLLTAERNVAQARSENSFNAIMTASMGYNQRAPILRDAYSDLLNSQMFNVGFSIPIFRWGAGSEAVDAALAEQKRAETSVTQQRHDFEQEVRYQVSRLNLLAKQVAVAAKSGTIAQRRFEVAKDRYLIGKIDIPNLFLAQSEKDNAIRANIQTMWNYWAAYFRVRALTLHDFERGSSLLLDDVQK
jgi:outer membrane protein